jgi:ParB-like chromosome segregation protein Spo0J
MKRKNSIPEIKKEFVELALNEIIPYERNNRKHTKKDVNEVIKSIQKDGYISPIVVDEKNMIIAGHARLEALKKLKVKQVKVLMIF